jgi:hypothetical protein
MHNGLAVYAFTEGEALLLIPSVGIPTGGGNAVSWMRTSQNPDYRTFALLCFSNIRLPNILSTRARAESRSEGFDHRLEAGEDWAYSPHAPEQVPRDSEKTQEIRPKLPTRAPSRGAQPGGVNAP